MPSPKTLSSSDEILLIKNAPLTRVQSEGLRAVGVEVAHLTPEQVIVLLRDDNQRPEAIERLAGAALCILGEGAGLDLAPVVLRIREGRPGRTITTSESVRDISAGMDFSNTILGGPPGGVCEFVHKKELVRRLRTLADPTPVVTAPMVTIGSTIRPAKPLPYVADPTGHTHDELHHFNTDRRGHDQLMAGRITAGDLLSPGGAGRFRHINGHTALSFLIQHLPGTDLTLMAGEEMDAWWASWVSYVVAVNARFPGPWRRLADLDMGRQQVETLLWSAVCRDGGDATLARLPTALAPLRDEVMAQWDGAVREAAEHMERDLASASEHGLVESVGARMLKEWHVIPCEDPLGVDADPNRFRPTKTTLEVASLYRTAPEVILAARERWGTRPYQEHLAEQQLEEFVAKSPPTSAAEVDGWVRVAQTLPPGRMRTSVLRSMNRWTRMEIEIAEAWGYETDIHPYVYIVPCLDRDGKLIPEKAMRLPRKTQDDIRKDWGMKLARGGR